jgi:hypothetical protein
MCICGLRPELHPIDGETREDDAEPRHLREKDAASGIHNPFMPPG